MASRSLGTLTLDLVVKAGAFTAGMTAAERQADKSLSAIEKRAYKFGQAVGTSIKAGAILAVAALGTIALAVGQAIDKADEMRDLSIRTGVATEKLSEYAYAAKQTGTDIDGLGRGLKILSKNLAEAADPKSAKGGLFAALGVDVKDAAGNLKQLDVILPEIANKFKLIEDGTTKAALAQELFGKSGVELIEFLNQGAVGLEEMGEKAKSLGIIIGTDTANAADEFNDRLGDLRAQVDGLSLQIAAGLLPKLNETTGELGNLIKQGDTAANIVSLLNSVIGFGVGIINTYNDAVRRTALDFELAAKAGAGFLEIQQNVSTLGYADGSVAGGVKLIGKAWEENGEAIKKLNDEQRKAIRLAEVVAQTAGQYTESNTRKRGGGLSVEQLRANAKDRAEAEATQKRLAAMFSGGTGAASKSKGGKSDAEKEADKLKAAYDRMNESLTEQIGLFNVKGEAAKVVYEFEHGELSKLTDIEAKRLGIDKEALIAKAEELDLLGKEKDAEEALVKARAEQDRDFNNVNDAIKEQIALVGMTRDEMEIYNNLAAAGVDAESARGKEIIENTRRLQEMSEAMADQIELMDEIRGAGADFLSDWIGGSKSFKDSLLDAWESVHQKILQMISENLMEKLFGKQGDPAGGSSGDWLGGLVGALFGSSNGGGSGAESAGSLMDLFGGAWGFANGGNTKPWSVSEVNERGFEMASVGGKDYLLTGAQSVKVTPNNKLGRSGAPVTQIFNNPVMYDQRSETQRAQEAARKLRNATRFA